MKLFTALMHIKSTLMQPFISLRGRYRIKRVEKGIKILEMLEAMMIRAGYGRVKRRQFWREFSKRQANRDRTFQRLRETNK